MVVEKKNEYNRVYNSKIRDFMMRINMLDSCFFDDEFDYSILSQIVDEVRRNNKPSIDYSLKSESSNYESFKNALTELVYNEV